MNKVPAPPPGFVPLQSSGGSVPPPPPGFVPINAQSGTLAKGHNPWVETAIQGLTFGYSDEMQAAAKSAFEYAKAKAKGDHAEFKKLYESNLQAINDSLEQQQKEHPIASTAIEMAGTVPTTLAFAPAKLGQAIGMGAKMLQSAKYGAALGAVSGAGHATPDGRTEGVAKGAVLGGAIGAVVPPVSALAGKAVSTVADKTRQLFSAKPEHAAHIIRALQRDEITPQTLAENLQKLGPSGVIADAGGENVQGLARGIASIPGAARNMAGTVLRDRQAGTIDRVTSAMKQFLSKNDDFYGSMQKLQIEKETAARPIYEQVLKQSNIIPDDQFSKISSDKFFEKVFARVKKDPLYKIGEMPNNAMPVVDSAKRYIDDMIGKAVRAGQNNKVRLLSERKNDLVKMADDAFPDYASARNAFAGPSQLQDAMTLGRKFITSDAEVTRDILAGLTDSEREFFRAGAMRALRDKALSQGGDAYKSIMKGPLRERVQTVFGDQESFNAFEKLLKNEQTMFNTKSSVLGGSPTARIQAEQSDLLANSGIAYNLARGDVPGVLASVMRRIKTSGGMLPEKTKQELANALFSQSPEVQQQVIKQLKSEKAYKALGVQMEKLLQTGTMGATVDVLNR